MSSGIGTINLKVLLFDTDFYALQSINGYLAWDRRTRVTYMAETLDEVWAYLRHTPLAEQPDVVVMDADHMGGTANLKQTIALLREKIAHLRVICLTQNVDPALVEAAADANVSAFLLKQEVRFQIAWAIVFTLNKDFVVTSGVQRACSKLFNTRIFHAAVLPDRREYPELTQRIKQALQLVVVEGMPAHLAADEMGISLHTIRGYIKEGYRILESHDETEYPRDMTPQERAFMRFTALAHDDDDKVQE
ncbi:MAG: response regulator transcription factor [Armatimonadetes bacterium]|nr:response regulator transcription factor [Anaerolineae bacterium]